MAENDEYYKELVAKQQELLVTLISPKKQPDNSGEIEKLQKRFATFSQSLALIRQEIRFIKQQLLKMQTEFNNFKNELILSKLSNEDFAEVERHPEEINQPTLMEDIAEPLSQQILNERVDDV